MTSPAELADRVEGLDGPCRETDAMIDFAIGNDRSFPYGMTSGPGYYFNHGDIASKSVGQGLANVAHWFGVPKYTTSLDAAMTLVPEGWNINLFASADCADVQLDDDRISPMRHPATKGKAATPALALCAAALRAMQP